MERANSFVQQNQIENLAIEAFQSDGFLIVNKTLIKVLGIIPAALLSNYIDKYNYFRKKNPDNDGWFFSIHANQMEQLNISEFTLRKHKTELINLGILKTMMKGIPAKEWFKIDFEKLVGVLGLALSKTKGLDPLKTKGLIKDTKFIDTKNIQKINFLDMFPLSYQKDETFQTAIKEFITHRKEKGQKLTELSCQKLANKLSTFSIPICITAINSAIENNWTGVFPENIQEKKKQPKYAVSKFRPAYKDNVGRYYLNEEDGEYYHKNGDKYID